VVLVGLTLFRIILIFLVGSLRASTLFLDWVGLLLPFLEGVVGGCLGGLRSAIIDENCLTVDMNEVTPHVTNHLRLTAVSISLSYDHACATKLILRLPHLRPIQGGRRTSQPSSPPPVTLNSIQYTSNLTTVQHKSTVRPHLSALLSFLLFPAALFSSSCHSFQCVALLCAAVARALGDPKVGRTVGPL
jgi:hypothetical protein